MDTGKILWELKKEPKISGRLRRIMKTLLNENKALTAEEICEKAEVPKGRVYKYLNDLIDKELILKKDEKPAKYWIDSLEQRIIRHSYSNLSEKAEGQKEFISEIKDYESITPISEISELTLLEAKEKIIGEEIGIIKRNETYPFFFYPKNNWEKHFEFREKLGRFREERKHFKPVDKRNQGLSLESTKKALEEGVPVKYVIGKSSYERFTRKVAQSFDSKKLKETLQRIQDTLEKNDNLEVRVVEEPCNYALLITDKSLVFGLIERTPEETFVTGFLLRGGESVDRYWSIFNTRYREGENLEKLIQKTLEGVE